MQTKQKDYLDRDFEEVFIAKGNRIVARSPSFSMIITKLLSGDSPEYVSSWLKLSEHEEISPSSIRDYMRKYIPDRLRVNPDLIRYMHSVGVGQIDELSESVSLIFLQKRRVEALLKAEQRRTTPEKVGYNRLLRHELALYSTLLQQIINLKKDLGILGENRPGRTDDHAELSEGVTVIISAKESVKTTKVVKEEKVVITEARAIKLAGLHAARKENSDFD